MSISFQEFLNGKSIFKDPYYLSPQYLPEYLPYREEQLSFIFKTLSIAFKGSKPKNIIIYGKTGTGKTATAKYVLRELRNTAKERNATVEGEYINCRVHNSSYRILFSILKERSPDVKTNSMSVSMLYERLRDYIEERRMQMILFLDEVDFIRDLDEVVYMLSRINEDLERGGVSIVAVSNKLSFRKQLSERSRSSLYESELVFPPYSADQLREILKHRAEKAFGPNVLEEGALNYISAVAANESGDARYAIKLLLKSAEVADSKGDSKITVKHVDEARKLVDYDLAEEVIKTLPKNLLILLYSIALLTEKKKSSSLAEDVYILSGELYEFYRKTSKALGVPPKTARWYRKYVNDLEELGLVNTLYTGKGFRGRTRVINIGHDPSDVKKIVENLLKVK